MFYVYAEVKLSTIISNIIFNPQFNSGRFTSSHGVLSASSFFISARQQALQLAEEVNANTELIEVYAYSGFYPYYEQVLNYDMYSYNMIN